MPASPSTNATQPRAARGTTTIVSHPVDRPLTADPHPVALAKTAASHPVATAKTAELAPTVDTHPDAPTLSVR
jgi:hypothetical protein